MKTSFRIARLIGIPIKIHFSFIIILGLFAWLFSFESIQISVFIIGYGGISTSIIFKAFLGIFLAILFFICVLLHELGHSYVTQKYGYKINGITLFLFGGASQIKETPREPDTEIKIAIAGPGVSFLLGGIFLMFFLLTNYFSKSILTQIFLISFGTLAFYNLILGLFNLVPAYPTDGGRLVRATLAKRMDYGKATSWASNIGKGIAIGMAVFGIIVLNIWLVLISVFLFFGATQEEKMVKISLALEDKKVKDIMNKNVKSVAPDMTIKSFLNFIKDNKNHIFPVVEEDALKGIVLIDDVQKIDSKDIKNIKVKDVMRKNFSKISSNKKASTALKRVSKDKYNRVFVEEDNKIMGVITRNDIIHALKMSKI